jgi:SAM-dependent methyltransferase
VQFLKSFEVRLRELRNHWVSARRYRGSAVHCPVCDGSFSQFLPAGTGARSRPGAVCPGCRSRERDRLAWLFLQARQDTLLYRHQQFLHIAPEPRLGAYLANIIGEGYITADLMRRDVMVRMDVQDMLYPNETLDAIYCSHVFQDVPDDRRAMAECFRVLRPGGWAILNVPLFAASTREAARAGKPRGRWDQRPDEHLREYGPDYADRLREAGFDVTVLAPADVEPDPARRERFGIAGERTGWIHFARRPLATGA